MAEELVICRCEEVSRREVEEAVALGAISVNEVKRVTRAGMGLCQGRTCGRNVRTLIAQRVGVAVGEVEPGTVRNPVRPIPLATLAECEK